MTLILVLALFAVPVMAETESGDESAIGLLSFLNFFSEESQKQADENTTTEVTQADIEKKIIGSWIVAERNGQPALTNEKCVTTFVSPAKAYMSASFGSHPELGDYWMNMSEAEVEINGNKCTITRKGVEGTTIVDELTITNITDTEKQGNLVVKSINDGKEEIITEESIRFVKVNDDFSDDVIGTWEGRCTSEESVFDDGQDHRWEFRDDGIYVYYVKDGDNWVPADSAEGDYIIAGNLLCGRWFDDETENREWWDITVDGDKMNWTALREGEDGETYTASFEMKRVQE